MRSFQERQESSVSVAVMNGILKLAFFFAEHHLPLAVADHLVSLISAICPDSKIAADMKAALTKMTAAVHTVAQDMHEDLVEILKSSFFSVVADESTDNAVTEQAAFAVCILMRAVDACEPCRTG